MACAANTDNVIESLQFPEASPLSHEPHGNDGGTNSADVHPAMDTELEMKNSFCQCLLCQNEYTLQRNAEEFHHHLYQEHHLIIEDPHLICNLKKYIEYWRKRFSQECYKELCNVVNNEELGEVYLYVLDASIPEDRQIREYIQRKRLDAVLEVQQSERDDTSLSRSCLFCREHFEGNRAELFNHMAFSHNFNIGQPDNIVFANELLDLLEKKLQSLQCLYCEKIFRDRTALKDHMRKKQHRRLNANNKTYDRFYVINYLEAGKDWQEVQAERDIEISTPDSENEESWADWDDDLHTNLVCLFCKHSESQLDHLLTHMQQEHNFDLCKMRDQLNLNFYEQVKMVNFIRRYVHQGVCVYCDEQCGAGEKLIEHSASCTNQGTLLQRAKWDQPQFLFPTYENDALLCSLEDTSCDEDEDETSPHPNSRVPILAEDEPISEDCFLLRERDVLQSLISSR